METGDSWRWQLERQLGLGRGTSPKDSWGGAAVVLAGSPRHREAPEGGLGEAEQEDRSGWSQTGFQPRLAAPQPLGGAQLQPRGGLRSTRRTQMTCRGGSRQQPRPPQGACVSSPPALRSSPSVGGSQPGLGEARGGSGQFLSGEGAELPGLLPWGWLENKQAGSLTSDCLQKSQWGWRGKAALGEEGHGAGAPGQEGDRNEGSRGGVSVVSLSSFPKLLLGYASQPDLGRQVSTLLVAPEHLAWGVGSVLSWLLCSL